MIGKSKTAVATVAMAGLLAGTLASMGSARADTITIQQYFSPAPNVFGSPSWAGYVANAMNSLENNLGNIGNPATDPTAYYQLNDGIFTPGMAEVTSFNSWMGQAGPAAPFNNELGNRLHAGVVITDTGGTFTLADVSFAMHSSDTAADFTDAGTCPSGAGGSLCWENDLSGTDFSKGTRIGINFGGDGAPGGGDDTVYDTSNPGNDATPLNELVYVGDGNAFWPGGPGDSLTGQAAMDEWTNYMKTNHLSISNVYCVKGTCNQATVAIATPEPASIAVLGFGMLGLGLRRLRRRKVTRD